MSVIKWPAEAIWEAVAPLLPGFTVEVLPEIDSTSSELMRRLRAGQPEPTLLVAERQTAGRGRLGRDWKSAVGDSLTFSLSLPLAPADWSGLSLAVGVSVAESLHPDLQLKWPNDVWLEGRKLGGILIETAGPGSTGRHVVIGIGINIAVPSADAAQGLSTPPAGLRERLPGIDAATTLLQLAEPLVRNVLLFEQHGFAAFQTRFARHDLLLNRPLRLSNGVEGIGRGVDAGGALQVMTSEGLQAITSAEVSVRPAGD
ncbi:biotin--[acetyl-CoA-carboxylase] ligase [Rhodoferax koreense]|uniref:biotin--[biotin carboxyl-carrier protein] ligase n=1 Tax=Rhodoferax koreensis TaxID=1842727 RepID=A0A1P8K2Z3_9BURK|nr:biotin--[acetyl-CoA-carboxylase] ligase [Rhodoferax koreense]APW40301.1 biotin--[acetyl-CoA-carboxylase] ligase [Rhodoferax koreense]